MLTESQSDVASSVNLTDACLLAVVGIKSSSPYGGILAETSSGVVTDASWKCSGDIQIGWNLASFDDAAWSQAQVVAPNDGSNFAFFAEISPQAKWIWAQDSSGIYAFCRKRLC